MDVDWGVSHPASCTLYLGQLEEDPRRLDELAAQDPQVGLRVEVQAVEHRGGGGQLVLRHQGVVDGQVDLGVNLVPDEDPIVVRGRVGRCGHRIRGHFCPPHTAEKSSSTSPPKRGTTQSGEQQ